jgi:biphenyl 2,3-dioxygenase beta subunit
MTTELVDPATTSSLSATQLQYEIEQFLYHEAQLLDEWRYREWYGLLAEDLHYWMPIRKNRLRRQRAESEIAPRGIEMAHFDDDKKTMDIRILQKETGKHWAEEPPSRTRHLISNIRVAPASDGEPDTFEVRSNFIVYRNRLETEVDVWAGERFDRLRRKDGSFEIAKRTILLDQNVVLSKNLSILF